MSIAPAAPPLTIIEILAERDAFKAEIKRRIEALEATRTPQNRRVVSAEIDRLDREIAEADAAAVRAIVNSGQADAAMNELRRITAEMARVTAVEVVAATLLTNAANFFNMATNGVTELKKALKRD